LKWHYLQLEFLDRNLGLEDHEQGLCRVADAINGLSTRGAIAHFGTEMRVEAGNEYVALKKEKGTLS
jgi:hypothetical protein